MDPDHRRIAAGRRHGVAHHRVVVLLPDPAPGGPGGAAEDGPERRHGVPVVGGDRGGRRGRRRGPGPVIFRRPVGKRPDRQVCNPDAVLRERHAPGVGQAADDGEFQPPFPEHRRGRLLAAGAEHHQHPFLALREHDLVGRHALLPLRDAVEVEFHPEAALGRHLEGRGCQAGRAHVLDRDDGVRAHEFEAGLDQQLAGKRVAHLHGRAHLIGLVVEGRGRHGGPVDAVAPGPRADIDDGIADARRRRAENTVGRRDADRHGVHQDVAVIGGVEGAFAADGRHADAVPVAADARDHAGGKPPRRLVVGRAEAQRIQDRHGPRAHGEHVAQYAADARGRALVRLDEGGMVVAFHLEDRRQPAADIDGPGVLPRSLEHPGRFHRQRPQPRLRGLVGAMLAPHGGEDAELDLVGRPAEDFQHARIFVRREAAMLLVRAAHAASASNNARPSVPPRSASAARSGCGIMPRTLRLSFRMPAMSPREPLGLSI